MSKLPILIDILNHELSKALPHWLDPRFAAVALLRGRPDD